jgi:hypothetical protein
MYIFILIFFIALYTFRIYSEQCGFAYQIRNSINSKKILHHISEVDAM